ncbi:MAG TPA: LLM class flavin-dependent oxidoreductase [Nitrososphaeraceae archaeon]|nr:LLM class flavin-dependent oxidoreductase [Nitrososphaeraceae archaeon]
MTKLGYWASQEQYSMNDLFEFVKEAEKAGFDQTLTSDHFHPWSHNNGYGNFTWIWLAAAAERTKNMKFITGVTAAVYRYNPAIIAQAFASLDVLYPGRIGLGVGTGEAMNEVSVGFDWPSADTRLERTTESIKIIKKLWNKGSINGVDNGKEIRLSNTNNNNNNNSFANFNGQYFKLKNAKLYTPPSTNIPLYMAASGKEAIQTAGRLTDGLITTSKPNSSNEVFDLFNKAAKEVGKDPDILEKIAKPKISYSEDYDEAFKSCEFWRTSEIDNAFDRDINDPRILEKIAKEEVSDDELRKSILIITSIEDLIKPIEEYFNAGFTQVYTHSTSPNEIEFIKKFANKVISYFEDKNK